MAETPAQKVIRIQRELYAIPEQEIARRLQRMSETQRLFAANATELFRMISLYTDSANATSIWALQNSQRSHDLQRVNSMVSLNDIQQGQMSSRKTPCTTSSRT